MKLTPTGSYVCIKHSEKSNMSKGGIALPASAAENTESQEGTVVNIGPDVKKVAIDDVVIHAKYGGSIVNMDGAKYLLIEESSILAIKELKKDGI